MFKRSLTISLWISGADNIKKRNKQKTKEKKKKKKRKKEKQKTKQKKTKNKKTTKNKTKLNKTKQNKNKQKKNIFFLKAYVNNICHFFFVKAISIVIFGFNLKNASKGEQTSLVLVQYFLR